jgi:hypothetical protein
MTIPSIKTSGEYWSEEYANDPQGALFRALLSDLTGSRQHFPTYNDQNEVDRKARDDFRRNDFSDAFDYIDSLVKIADFWQEKAETYHSELSRYGATFDQYGDPDLQPFAVTRGGKWLTGTADSFDLTDPNHIEDAVYFLRRWLTTLTDEDRRQKVAALIVELESERPELFPGTNEALDALTILKEDSK